MKTLFAIQSRGAKHFAHLVDNSGNFELVHDGGAGSRKTLERGVDMLISHLAYGAVGKRYTILTDNLSPELSRKVRSVL